MFFERHSSGERVVAVNLNIASESRRQDIEEFKELIVAAGGMVASVILGARSVPNSNTFVGKGKLDEIREQLHLNSGNVVIFNHSLMPTQERNLEKALKCKVVDRTGLILDIFAQRAKSHEGKLQVELAQLRHLSTRLIKGWSHLERQRGGIGQRGPGETQLETDRRLIQVRVKSISSKLSRVRRQRNLSRKSRKKALLPTVALVGYTNVGKSTLFNSLTAAGVYAADKPFATLDPTLRKLDLRRFGPLVIADTVGFVRDLPHQLVDAFKATLEEAVSADLLIHVIDASSEHVRDHVCDVESVLEDIGAAAIPKIEVYNKIDMLDLTPRLDRDRFGIPCRVWLSSKLGQGLDILMYSLAEKLGSQRINRELTLSPDQGRFRSALHGLGAVKSEKFNQNGDAILSIQLQQRQWERLIAKEQKIFSK